MRVRLGKQGRIRKPAVTIQDPKCPKIAPKANSGNHFLCRTISYKNLRLENTAPKKAKAQYIIPTGICCLWDK